MDHRITKHSTIEQLVATDIDHWIANLYVQVSNLASQAYAKNVCYCIISIL